MYRIQDRTLQLFIAIFYKVGMWQSDDESYLRRLVKKTFFTIFFVLLLVFFAVNAALCEDRNESIFLVQAVFVGTVLFTKCLYLIYRKKEILEFLCAQSITLPTESSEEYELANRKKMKLMKFTRLYFGSIFITGFGMVVIQLPIFSTDKELPGFISLSWNDSEIVYWAGFLFMTVAVVVTATANLVTPFIWYIMLNYSIDYQRLGNQFRKGTENAKYIRLTRRSVFVENLIVLIKAHRHLTETIERFTSRFYPLFLAQIGTSRIGICFSVYTLAFTTTDNFIQTQMYVIILLYALFDIFLVMYLANEITLASDRLSYCLFESNWFEQNESCKAYVLIMGEVLKQPQELVILLYPLNLETFMAIINGAYSMFNILKSFQ